MPRHCGETDRVWQNSMVCANTIIILCVSDLGLFLARAASQTTAPINPASDITMGTMEVTCIFEWNGVISKSHTEHLNKYESVIITKRYFLIAPRQTRLSPLEERLMTKHSPMYVAPADDAARPNINSLTFYEPCYRDIHHVVTVFVYNKNDIIPSKKIPITLFKKNSYRQLLY